MIVSHLLGGLGNQMFQYAAGRALAITNNCELKLDVSEFENYHLHNGYELDFFNIQAEIASKTEVAKFVTSQSRLAKFINRRLRLTKNTHYVEKSFAFDTDFFNINSPIYIEGYWQSYKYFECIESQLRHEFSLKVPFSQLNSKTAKKIAKTNAVSIHVRRGDYVNNKHTNSVHGVCSLDYYRAAIQTIIQLEREVEFFVFSDDIPWVKSNLPINAPCIYVDQNTGNQSYCDMLLMAMCNHHIIANSSFSWWGAWLGDNPNKIVIAPKQWFANNTPTDDLIHKSWLRL